MEFDGYRTFTWQPTEEQIGDYIVLVTATDEHGASSSLEMKIRVEG
jgi:hypothetical protein